MLLAVLPNPLSRNHAMEIKRKDLARQSRNQKRGKRYPILIR
jgi:hypothetical protein